MPRSVAVLFAALGTLFLPGHGGWGSSLFSLTEREGLQKTLTFQDPKAEKTIRVNNVFGSIDVTGSPVGDVAISGEKTLRAESRAAIEKARREVRLDMTENGNTVDVSVNGPFRQPDGSIKWGRDDSGYRVQYDLKLQVPENANLVLKTISHGQVSVHNVSGRLQVSNVNGPIDVERIAGTLSTQTVNGAIRAAFRGEPAGDCRVKTVNGEVRLSFDAGLSADLTLSTANGRVLSDFQWASLPMKIAAGKRDGGKYVYRSGRTQRVRIGKGGPEISMETVNGNLVIAQAK